MTANKKPSFFSDNQFSALRDKTNREIARLARMAEKKSAQNFLNQLATIKGSTRTKAVEALQATMRKENSADGLPAPTNTPNNTPR